ncbi:MAG: hypothetical protein LBU74_05205 [Methanobacteriaceae archaeon]|jgi:hypothetical protein|nr:hypothetical protein [Candidatus Methanorudis spinitermitis]
MSDIAENVTFKRDSGDILNIDQKYVGLKARQNGILTVNFRSPEEEMNKIKYFFEGLMTSEPIKLDIGETGDIECYFKGISPLLEKKDGVGLNYFFLSVTLQELKEFEEEPQTGGCCF